MRRTIEQMMAIREDRVKQNLREVRRVITSIRKLIDGKNYADANTFATYLSTLIPYIKEDIVALLLLANLLEKERKADFNGTIEKVELHDRSLSGNEIISTFKKSKKMKDARKKKKHEGED